jgi:hypothetical protein
MAPYGRHHVCPNEALKGSFVIDRELFSAYAGDDYGCGNCEAEHVL